MQRCSSWYNLAMPTANFFYKDTEQLEKLENIASNLKKFLAEKLTCGDIALTPKEISIRFITAKGSGMIGQVEVEITAAAFKDRVEKQDQICLDITDFIKEKIPSLGEVKVWLILVELGHSWK
jgi:hypothetical protein